MINLSQLAIHLGAKEISGTIPLTEFVRVGLPAKGNCERCNVVLDAQTAFPCQTGNVRCEKCIGRLGWRDCETARKDLNIPGKTVEDLSARALEERLTKHEWATAHAAAKIIETDSTLGYYSCVEKYGKSVANALLVLYLRLRFNPQQQWPAPDDLERQVNETLKAEGIIK